MWMRRISTTFFLTMSGFAADRPNAGPSISSAPVLRVTEPLDSRVVHLPSPPEPIRAPREPLKEFTPPPAPPLSEAQLTTPPAATMAVARATKLPPSITGETRAVLRRVPKPVYPPDFERDSALYCQKRIGEWSEPDVYNLFGKALRRRPASGDDKEGGLIYAFNDPTGRYRAIELDFAADTGLLRSVFVYPWQMTWQDCQRQWGTSVSAAQANKGRTFYSFLTHRLDVLVDPGGKVVSLGLY